MIRTTTGSRRGLRLTGVALVLGTLAGCDENAALVQNNDKPAEAASTSSNKSTKLVERDVEAPDVFQVTEAALWDGRPSLGGVWVAHPDVTDPQRVIIRNTVNDKFVIGALFRRERDVPGPRLQASSDAAEALSMLAGAPVKLNVTALIREPVEPVVKEPAEEPPAEKKPAKEAPVAEESAAALKDNPEITETTLDPIAGAAAAIEASEPTPVSNSDTDASASPGAQAAEETAAKKGFKWPWAKPKSAEAATTAEVAAASAAAAATVAANADTAPAESPKPQQRSSNLTKPYIQIGIFSVQENAKGAADKIRSAGMIPTVHEQSSNDKPFWRVLVGPAQTRSERTELLKKVKDTGFTDAYTVTN